MNLVNIKLKKTQLKKKVYLCSLKNNIFIYL